MEKIKLENEFLEVIVSDVSAALVSFINKKTNQDIVLGYDELQKYLDDDKYIGASVGRVANRIANGTFILDHKKYQLDINNGPNHLHGGLKNLKHKIFKIIEKTNTKVILETTLYEADDHYPGDVTIQIIYELNNNSLIQKFKGKTTQKTLLNLTNHSYFNLTNLKDLREHKVTLNADYYYHVDANGLIKGEKQTVANTAFDFQTPKMIYQQLQQDDEQLKIAKGYDHYFLVNSDVHAQIETDKLLLQIESSYPGFQLYTANYLDNEVGKNNITYPAQSSICVECSYLPNGINKNDTNTILDIGQTYEEFIKYTLVTK